ncbi:MAG: DUF4012 domain-containing protein [Anaerolineae bacterium]|nr:DUF4012 domain-containing protein [Anaerolineae bacterium]
MNPQNAGATESSVSSPRRPLRAQRKNKKLSDPCDLRGKTTPATTENKGATRKRPRAFWRWFLILDLVLLLIGGGAKAIRAWRWQRVLQNDVAALRTLLQDVGGDMAVLSTGRPWSPAELLTLIHNDLCSFQAEFDVLIDVAPHFRWLPRYGADLATAPALLTMALELSQSAAQVAQALEALFVSPDQEQPQTLETVLILLREAKPQLEDTARALERVQETRAELDRWALSPRVARWVTELDRYLPLMQQGVQGALLLPELLGDAEMRTYLLLVQNEDELRPAGGFLTGVARIAVREGHIEHLYFENSAEVTDFKRPYPDPPTPLEEIMGLDLWVFHDSNWSPDFPTSARQAVAFYQQRYETPIDGVLAIDQEAFRRMVETLQPLDIPSYPNPITAANILSALRQSRDMPLEDDPRAAWEHRHKVFLEDLLTAAIDKVQNQPERVDFIRLGMAMIAAFEERHLFAYALQDDALAALLHESRWDGALYAGAGDYLMVVDANLGYSKVNPYITGSLGYAVDLRDPQQPQANLTLSYQHNGPRTSEPCYHYHKPPMLTYEQLMQQCYWDYARVYVPEGTRPLRATPNPIPGELLVTGIGRSGEAEVLAPEAGKSVFATFFVLPSGQRAETRMLYLLPPDVIQQTEDTLLYRLYIQKQGGKLSVPVQISLYLPPGVTVIRSSTPYARAANNPDHILYNLNLETDFQLSIEMKR